jgi:Tfp pilus assembly protein PilF
MRTTHTRIAAAVAVLLLGMSPTQPALAHDASGAPAKLGKVRFTVECNAAAQAEFDLAMAYYHSFAWELYQAPLDRALQADPTCGMAHWLRALGTLDNPFTWPVPLSPQALEAGQAALDAARRTGLKTERERDYVDALAAFYRDHDKLNHRTRAKAFEEAMAGVAGRYPEDTEATILYALVLSVNFDPNDKQYTNQLKAAGILEPIMVKQPEHPGVAHYLIHSYDYPPIAPKGLEAAKRYSKIAPDASHALHMPSHIFSRVGYWRESIDANRASAEAAKSSIPNRVHAYDYLVYAHLQLGQDRAAMAVIADAQRIKQVSDAFASAYGFAAMPARYALERHAWQEAANVTLSPGVDVYPWKKYPQAEAINAFARGIGAAYAGDPSAARVELERLQRLRDSTAAMKLPYWVEQIDIQAELVRGTATFADGKRADGIGIVRAAAVREDATEKHAVTPGPLKPAREILADLFMQDGKPADALREYEAVIAKEPNRLGPTTGAAQAAKKAGDEKKAAYHAKRVVALTATADSARPEIVQAKRVLGM